VTAHLPTRFSSARNLAAWILAPGSARLTRRVPVALGVPNAVSERPETFEAGLLRRIAGGDSAALGELYDRLANMLFALALRILHDPKEAEDVLQEVFLQVWDKAATFDPSQGRPLGWMLTLTRHKAIDRLRAAQRRARLVEEFQAQASQEGAEPSDAVEAGGTGDETELVRAAVARLPADHRRAIEMAFFSGLTQTEIAAALQQPLGTIKARIRRGMRKLRAELEPQLSNDRTSAPHSFGAVTT